MFGLSLPELLLILAVVVIVFGANKLPQLGAGAPAWRSLPLRTAQQPPHPPGHADHP